MICESIVSSLDHMDDTIVEADFDVALSMINAYRKNIIMESVVIEADTNKQTALQKMGELWKKFKDLMIGLFEKFLAAIRRIRGKKKFEAAAKAMEQLDEHIELIPDSDVSNASEPKFSFEAATVTLSEEERRLPKIKYEIRNHKLWMTFDLQMMIDYAEKIQNSFRWASLGKSWTDIFNNTSRYLGKFLDFPKPLSGKQLYSEHSYSFATAALLFRKAAKIFDDIYKMGEEHLKSLRSMKHTEDWEKSASERGDYDRYDPEESAKMLRYIEHMTKFVTDCLKTIKDVDMSLVEVADGVTNTCKSILRKYAVSGGKLKTRATALANG